MKELVENVFIYFAKQICDTFLTDQNFLGVYKPDL